MDIWWNDPSDTNTYYNSLYLENTITTATDTTKNKAQIVSSMDGISLLSENRIGLFSKDMIFLESKHYFTYADGYSQITKLYSQSIDLYNGISLSFMENNGDSNIILSALYLSDVSASMHTKNSSISLGNNNFDIEVANTTYIDITIGSGGSLEGGTWYYNNVEIGTTGSDEKIKHDINSLSDKYSLFFDQLRPVSFIYNKDQFGYGTSQRTHTGFIANEVETALINSGLTTQEFAGFVHQKAHNGQEDLLCLRYEEFIALNTSEIQKLKKRVAELESQIALLTNSN